MPFFLLILYGFFAACFAVVIELSILTLFNFSTYTALQTFPFEWDDSFSWVAMGGLLLVSLAEECAKYLFLRQYALRYFANTLSSVRGALILGAVFGLAFSLLELGLIFMNTSLAPTGAIGGLVIFHILTALLFGYYLLARSLARPWLPIPLLLAAIFLHTLYNGIVFFFF